MTDDTTRKGVPAVEPQGSVADAQEHAADSLNDGGNIEAKVSPRDEAMDAIAARREQELTGEADERADENKGEAAATQPAAEQPAGPVFQRDGVWMTRVKINGKEEEIPLDQVTARYQKDAAGDEKLRIAAERERQLAEKEQQLIAERDRLAALQQQHSRPSDTKDAGSVRVDEKELVDALMDGDEEAFTAKMRAYRQAIKDEVLGELGTNTASVRDPVTPEQIAAEVEDRIAMRTAIAAFESEYSDVVSDEYLRGMVSDRVQAIQKGDPAKPYAEILREAGNGVREWIAAKAGTKASTIEPSTRAERKRAATAATVSASARASIGEDEPGMPTPSQVIAEMRAARGQPT